MLGQCLPNVLYWLQLKLIRLTISFKIIVEIMITKVFVVRILKSGKGFFIPKFSRLIEFG